MNNISLYIPHVFDNISEERVATVFAKYGQVSKVDFAKKDGNNYKSAYIHFKEWNNDDDAIGFRVELADNKKARVVYDKQWFWIVLEYKKRPSTPDNSPKIKNNKKYKNNSKSLLTDVVRNLERGFENETRAQMAEVEQIMPVESMNLVDVSYVKFLEEQNATLFKALMSREEVNRKFDRSLKRD